MNFPREIVYKVVFIRHRESNSNKKNNWGSFKDVDLSSEGIGKKN